MKNRKKVLFKIRKKKTREVTLEKLAAEYAESLGMLRRKYVIYKRRNGLDSIYMMNGCVFFVEFKRPKKSKKKSKTKIKKKLKASPGQERELALLLSFNIPAYVCDNFDDAKSIIDSEYKRMTGEQHARETTS